MFGPTNFPLVFLSFSARYRADLLNKLKNVCSKAIGEKMKVSLTTEPHHEKTRFSPIHKDADQLCSNCTSAVQ